MKIINLFRYLTGYLEFKATGGFGDRFINLCTRYGTGLFNVSYKDNSIYACVPLKNIYKLKNIVKKSGVRLSLCHERGVYFTCKKYSNRIGLVLGVIFYIIFCLTMQQFIWCIDIQESNNVSQKEIKKLLDSYDLRFGTYISDFDEIQTSRDIINDLKGKIQWMAINIKGSKAYVEVHDYDKERKDDTYGDPCNIIADFDGVLLSLDAFSGEKAATVGNGINKGDLLISGIVENRDFSVSLFEARGKITALHTVNFSKTYKKPDNCKKISQLKNQTYLYFLGMKIPLKPIVINKTQRVYSNNYYLTLKSTQLPFGILRKDCLIKNKNNKAINNDFYCLSTLEKYCNDIYNKFKNTNITDYIIRFETENSKYNIYGKYTCIDFIGVKQPINRNIF